MTEQEAAERWATRNKLAMHLWPILEPGNDASLRHSVIASRSGCRRSDFADIIGGMLVLNDLRPSAFVELNYYGNPRDGGVVYGRRDGDSKLEQVADYRDLHMAFFLLAAYTGLNRSGMFPMRHMLQTLLPEQIHERAALRDKPRRLWLPPSVIAQECRESKPLPPDYAEIAAVTEDVTVWPTVAEKAVKLWRSCLGWAAAGLLGLGEKRLK